jgi:hypothetical protein
VNGTDEKLVHNTGRKLEGKILLDRPRCRWVDDIKFVTT